MLNQLISNLIAIKELSKSIHYSAHGEAFYGKHLFADRIQENIDGYIDSIKEDLLLGNNLRPLSSKKYLEMAIKELPSEVRTDNDKQNFKELQDLIEKTLLLIKQLDNLSRGDENLIGEIAQNLQNSKGLINLYLE